MARYRRTRPTGTDHLVATGTSLLIGAGAALASYYVARLFLVREELPQSGRGTTGAGDRPLRAGDDAEPKKVLGTGRSRVSGGAATPDRRGGTSSP